MMFLARSILLSAVLFVPALCAEHGGSPSTELCPIARKASPYAPSAFKVPGSEPHSRLLCTVPSTNSSVDAGPDILAAAQQCNNGGTVYFPAGQSWTIASPLDLTFLKNIDFAMLGTISFSDKEGVWEGKTFNYAYQNVSMFWRWGGTNVRIYGNGSGVIEGLGSRYWQDFAANPSVLRPILFGTDGLHQSSITDLTMHNAPFWFNLIANSSDVLISNLHLTIDDSDASAPAKNTDGWDTYRSSNIVIQDSVIVNGDDCVSFKPNSTAIIVQGLSCTGSHGVSVGSLGQYVGEVDIVEDLYIYNVSFTNVSDAARIKVWPGAVPGGGNASGGGTGYVRNVTYDAIQVDGADCGDLFADYDLAAITLTECYMAKNTTVCEKYPAALTISDVLFKDFAGVTSPKYDPKAGSLICSSADACSNIQAHDIRVTVPSGVSAQYTCTNLNDALLDLNCAAPTA